MTTATCKNGHTFQGEYNPYVRGFVYCPICHDQVWEFGATEAELAQDLADGEMMLAALEADRNLETELAGTSWDQQVQYVRQKLG